MTQYTQEQIYGAMRQADQAGDAEAVRALAKLLQEGASKDQINAAASDKGLQLNQEQLDANIASRDAGGPVNTVMPPERSAAKDVAGGVVNALGGALEGVIGGVVDFPLDVSRYVGAGIQNALGFAGGAALDAVGLDGAADTVRDAAYYAADQQVNNAPRAADVVESFLPTSPGGEGARFAGQLIGGFAIPGGARQAPNALLRGSVKAPGATSNAQQIVQEGARRGVDVMTSDVAPPRNFVTKSVQAIGERIPYAGTGGPRAAQNEQRVEAVRDFAKEYGVTGEIDFIGDVAKDFLTRRGRQLGVLSGRKKQVIESIQTPYTASPSAVAEIDRQVARLTRQNIGSKFNPIIQELQDFKAALTDGRKLEDIEVARKALGEAFEADNLANIKQVGQDAVNAVYAPLRDDMADFIKRNAGDEAHSRWASANAKLAEMVGDLSDGAFKRALQGADVTPERVSTLLFSKKPSETRRLFRGLSASGKNKARSAVVYEALRRAKAVDESAGRLMDELSPQTFANKIDDLAKPMGVMFDKADLASANGLARLIQATQRASVAAAAPPTGVQNTGLIGASLLTDWFGSFGAATTSAAAYGLAARFYESAPIRNMLASLSKTNPGSRQEAALVARIESVAASQLGLGSDNIGRAINDNPAGRLAAQEQPEE